MGGWGGTLILLGAGSFLLNMIGMEFILLSWVDMWGTIPGIGIRLGVIALGVVILAVGGAAASDE
ncbi:hypothetical protein [Blastopirellula retiformator]|uniref:DUF378 domain-containing protein n=1 Tax=Blastopirellula retiformator TaxID=2527970 RepID=A0A5C5V4B6_9BACT|nr:hypothetical protein [Blastopirellula retiformator]TWT33394.1 hypothetical protein Enr8_32220 [Blastopirellula retiformator]